MGTSLSDIPARYRSAAAKKQFIDWLAELPVLDPVKRNLIKTWCRITKTNFDAHEYTMVGLTPPGE
jgi:hypothetical protein